jgi:hypothetical protein
MDYFAKIINYDLYYQRNQRYEPRGKSRTLIRRKRRKIIPAFSSAEAESEGGLK